MRVLVATRATQGDYESDYAHALDGELVRLPLVECTRCEGCGCGRGFSGIGSHRATTTVEVVDRPDLTYEAYAELMWDDLSGQIRQIGIPDADDRGDLLALHDHDVRMLATLASQFPIGSIVRRRGLEVFRDPIAA